MFVDDADSEMLKRLPRGAPRWSRTKKNSSHCLSSSIAAFISFYRVDSMRFGTRRCRSRRPKANRIAVYSRQTLARSVRWRAARGITSSTGFRATLLESDVVSDCPAASYFFPAPFPTNLYQVLFYPRGDVIEACRAQPDHAAAVVFPPLWYPPTAAARN